MKLLNLILSFVFHCEKQFTQRPLTTTLQRPLTTIPPPAITQQLKLTQPLPIITYQAHIIVPTTPSQLQVSKKPCICIYKLNYFTMFLGYYAAPSYYEEEHYVTEAPYTTTTYKPAPVYYSPPAYTTTTQAPK